MGLALLLCSLVLQLVAAVLALQLVRKTSNPWAWVLIALGLVLMASRRAVTLSQLLLGHRVNVHLTAEVIALAISILMVSGVALIGPMFERLRRAEQLVRSREREVREMLDSILDGLVLIRDGRWVYANPIATRLLSLDASKPAALRTLAEVVPAEQRPRLLEGPLHSEAEPGRSLEIELQGRAAPTTVEFVTGPILDHESEPARLIIVRDLTERKAMEARLLQTQKLEALGRLTGGIAHDFNNLLTIIMACTSVAQRDLAGHPAASILANVIHASERGAALTAQLLAFSHHGTGRTELADLGEIVGSMRSLLHTLVGSPHALEISGVSDLRPISGDRSQIEQVLANLVVNARDAMTEAGTITIATRNVHLDGHTAKPWGDAPDGDYVVLAVSDQGAGMSAEVLARIFDPFFTTKGPGKGTGLGLATCYAIAGRHRGAITVSTKLGHGSTFELWLPAAEGTPTRAARRAGQVANPPPMAILVVDDEPMVRTIAGRILRGAGHDVVEAENAAAALAVLEQRQDFALLFTDIVMPGMSGVQLAEQVNRSHPSIGVLFTSGYAAELAGRDGFEVLSKPYTPDALLARVHDALERAAARSGTATG